MAEQVNVVWNGLLSWEPFNQAILTKKFQEAQSMVGQNNTFTNATCPHPAVCQHVNRAGLRTHKRAECSDWLPSHAARTVVSLTVFLIYRCGGSVGFTIDWSKLSSPTSRFTSSSTHYLCWGTRTLRQHNKAIMNSLILKANSFRSKFNVLKR